MFVVFTKEKKELDKYINAVDVYVNYGAVNYEVYDQLEEDYVDSIIECGNEEETQEWYKKMCDEYGFDINNKEWRRWD